MELPKHPDFRSKRVLATDMWDREDWERAFKTEPGLRDLITRFDKARVPNPADLVGDQWAALFRIRPKLMPDAMVRDDARVPLAIMETLMGTDGYDELHEATMGDLVLAARTVLDWEGPTYELLRRFEQAKKAFDQLQKARDKRSQPKGAQSASPGKDQGEGGAGSQGGEQPGEGTADGGAGPAGPGTTDQAGPAGPGTTDQQEEGQGTGESLEDDPGMPTDEEIERLQAAANQALENARLSAEKTVQQMVDKAIERAEGEGALARALGAGQGQGDLKHMSLKERQKISKLFDNPKFRTIAEWFGRMESFTRPHEVPVPGIPEELVGLRRGSDPLADLVPEELAMLHDPDLELIFLQNLANEDLPLYDYLGSQMVGMGGLVVCIDESGSMQGEPDTWAKAVALALFGVARKQHRPFAVIHFEHGVRLVQEFTQMSMDEAVKMATTFFGGGTAFIPPIEEGLKFLEKEALKNEGFCKSDIVFITDGQPADLYPGGTCTVLRDGNDLLMDCAAWLGEVHKRLDKVGGTIWGLAVNNGESWSLKELAEGKVIPVSQLANKRAGSQPLGKMFKAVANAAVRARAERKRVG